MVIKNFVSKDFLSTFIDSIIIMFSIAAYPVCGSIEFFKKRLIMVQQIHCYLHSYNIVLNHF